MVTFDKKLQSVIDAYGIEMESFTIHEENPLKDIDVGIDICVKYLQRLRNTVINGGLKGPGQEICFFKEVKPMVVGQLLYLFYLQQVECEKPRGTNKMVLTYLKNRLKDYNRFLQAKHICYFYYRRGSTFNDEQFFVRKNFDPKKFLHHPFSVMDVGFTTQCDNLFADFRAHEMIIEYMSSRMDSLELDKTNQKTVPRNRPDHFEFKWTDKKVYIAELAYALVGSRSINNGDANVKRLGEYIGWMFNVEKVDVYGALYDIQKRDNPTAYLDKLKDSFAKKIETLLGKKGKGPGKK
ncbi:RteC domain-containing protein [Saccharicrinis sp. GN24d3]|uniref:RteC domain-containing protein n=1 Tax=Saccharicrinis sp. GN24d3 TaxID=3458416 RepID=UPI004036A19A